MAKAKRSQQRTQARRPHTSGASQPASATKPGDTTKPTATPSTGAARLAPSSGRAGAQMQRGRATVGQPWWRRNRFTLIVIGAVLALVVIFTTLAQLQNQQSMAGLNIPVPADVLNAVTHVAPTVSAQVGAGSVKDVFLATPKHTPILTGNGKPEIVYVGADWCPYCAATRWSTVVALSRFGSFKGLTLMKSSSVDVYPSTATFSFQSATYTSAYIYFSATETQDRSRDTLATPPPGAAEAFNQFDAPPYTAQTGGVPFMSYGDQYVTTSGLFVPTMLQNLTWQQIAAKLSDPTSPVTQAIVGGANYQTAAICKLTKDQPGSVCATPEIQKLEAALPQQK